MNGKSVALFVFFTHVCATGFGSHPVRRDEAQGASPPAVDLKWDITADDVGKQADDAIAKYKSTVDAVVKTDAGGSNFKNVFLALNDASTAYDQKANQISFYGMISLSKTTRDAASKAVGAMTRFSTGSDLRADIQKSKESAQKNMQSSGELDKLDPESQKLVKAQMMDGKRNGLALSKEDGAKYTDLNKQLDSKVSEYKNSINKNPGKITFSADELKGVPDDYSCIFGTRMDGSKHVYDIILDDVEIDIVARYASDPVVRRRALAAYEGSLAANAGAQSAVFDLRRQVAKVLGYESWAAYSTETNMLNTPQSVNQFLDQLQDKLKPIGAKEKDALEKLRSQDAGKSPDSELNVNDVAYYENSLLAADQKSFNVDDDSIDEYFPVSRVIPEIVKICESLLALRLNSVKNSSVWSKDVQQFAVWDTTADAGGFLGYLYLDLFPRPGKTGGVFTVQIIPGYDLPDGKRNHPVTAVIANFEPPTGDDLGLMLHGDIVSIFREMGNAFHSLLSKTKYARFHGVNVAGDFAEVPALLFENWAWNPDVLISISSHYQTKEKLPNEAANHLVNLRDLNGGLSSLYELFLAKYDMRVHSADAPTNYTELWNQMRDDITLIKGSPGAPDQAAFSSIVLGPQSGASYYGRPYAQVLAADMFASGFSNRGAVIREKVLRFGGGGDEMASVKDFLGREPSLDPFVARLSGNIAR